MGPAETGRITVTVVCSPAAGLVEAVTVSLPVQSTAQQAIEASSLPVDLSALNSDPLRIGIWGKPCAAGDILRDRDRVEVYRPLLIDPKDARRARQRQQGKSR